MEQSVWVVWAVDGEYSDRQEWIVGAFSSEAMASEWVKAARAAQRELLSAASYSYPNRPTMAEREAFRAKIGDQRAFEDTEFSVEGLTVDALAVYASHGTVADSGQG